MTFERVCFDIVWQVAYFANYLIKSYHARRYFIYDKTFKLPFSTQKSKKMKPVCILHTKYTHCIHCLILIVHIKIKMWG